MDEKTVNKKEMDMKLLDALYAAKSKEDLLRTMTQMRKAKVEQGLLNAAESYVQMVLGGLR